MAGDTATWTGGMDRGGIDGLVGWGEEFVSKEFWREGGGRGRGFKILKMKKDPAERDSLGGARQFFVNKL